MPTTDKAYCTWRSQLRDFETWKKYFFPLFVCLFVYLIIFAIRGRFILFTFFGVFPHFSVRIRHPQVSAVRVLQTPLPSCCVRQFIQRNAFGKVKIQFFYGLKDPFCFFFFFVVNSIVDYKWWWYYPLRKCRRGHLGIRLRFYSF